MIGTRMALRAALGGLGVAALAGCLGNEQGDSIEDLEATSVVVDGREYVVTRSERTVNGEVSEGWSVVVDGLAVACQEPTRLSCSNAVRDFSI